MSKRNEFFFRIVIRNIIFVHRYVETDHRQHLVAHYLFSANSKIVVIGTYFIIIILFVDSHV